MMVARDGTSKPTHHITTTPITYITRRGEGGRTTPLDLQARTRPPHQTRSLSARRARREGLRGSRSGVRGVVTGCEGL